MNKSDAQIIRLCNIVDKYVVSGIPASSIKAMCKELNVNKDKLNEFLNGQTMAMIGNEGIIYSTDVKRFIRGLPVID